MSYKSIRYPNRTLNLSYCRVLHDYTQAGHIVPASLIHISDQHGDRETTLFRIGEVLNIPPVENDQLDEQYLSLMQ